MTFKSILLKQKSVANISSCYMCYIMLYRYVNMDFCIIIVNGNHFQFYVLETQYLIALFEHFYHNNVIVYIILIFKCTIMCDDADLECNKNVYLLTSLTLLFL